MILTQATVVQQNIEQKTSLTKLVEKNKKKFPKFLNKNT